MYVPRVGKKHTTHALSAQIGYPTSPNVTDPEDLERYYSMQEPFDLNDFFGNVLRARVANVRRLWNKIGAERDAGEWDMIPSEVNAYYSSETNEITFPSGMDALFSGCFEYSTEGKVFFRTATSTRTGQNTWVS